MVAGQEPLSEIEVRAVDAAYQPFPDFADWPAEPDRPDLWRVSAEELAALREGVAEDEMVHALRVVVRTAAIETGAIEGLYSTNRGLTITVATQAAMWEGALSEKGVETVALFEAQLRTYDLVLDATTKNTPITEVLIRRLHEELTAPQGTYDVVTSQGMQRQKLPKGEYKHHPNHVKQPDGSMHAYAPVEMTGPEMGRFVANLNSDRFQEAHPALQASYAHYVLTAIHPFADGNGRVARALSSVYFYRAVSLPVLVLSDQWDEYFRALAAADDGMREPFVAFISEAGRTAMAMVAVTLRASGSPEPEETLGRFRHLFTAQGGLTFHELDQLATTVGPRLAELVQDRIGSLSIPRGVEVAVMNGQGRPPQPIHSDGFRAIVTPGPIYIQVDFSTAPPAHLQQSILLNVLVSTEKDEARTIRLEDEETGDGVTFALRELHPDRTIAADYRLQAFAELTLGRGLERLFGDAEQAMQGSPYGD